MNRENYIIYSYCDVNFLHRFLGLYQSIRRTNKSVPVVNVCLCENSYNVGNSLKKSVFFNDPNLIFIHPDEIYKTSIANKSLGLFKQQKEFYFYLSAFALEYIYEKFRGVNYYLYLDADIFFYDDPDILISEIENLDFDICASKHHLNYILSMLGQNHGHYNVGVNIFNNKSTGLKPFIDNWIYFIDNWQTLSPLKYFSDQIYLDYSDKFSFKIIDFKSEAVNIGPWGKLSKFKMSPEGYTYNDKKLVCFHYSGIKEKENGEYFIDLSKYFSVRNSVVFELYKEYVEVVSIMKNNILEFHNNKTENKILHTSNVFFRYLKKMVLLPLSFSNMKFMASKKLIKK